jgi:GT2 family glycosyltransferase
MSARPRRIVVLGMMTKMPVAGVVWQTLHYVLGLRRLGFDPYYVETHGRTPSMLMKDDSVDGPAQAAAFIAALMRRFDLGDRWAYRPRYDETRCFGMSEGELERLYGSAELLFDLHGGTEPLPELSATDRLVYLETDPAQLQVELASGLPATLDFLDSHCAYFTYAENYGGADCGLPVSDRYDFHTTRQPVLTDLWQTSVPPEHDVFTTIGNWRQHWRDIWFQGETYTWSKHEEFEKFLDLPTRVGKRFELALGSYADQDRLALEAAGWQVAHAADFTMDTRAYRDYIAHSFGEFTVAKDQNVRLRTGWFSDRSATYLAAGRPVVTQDTGFGCALPTGEGLFSFASGDEVVEAIARIDGDPQRHRRAAREIACEYFAHDVVLGELLNHLGVDAPRPGRSRRSSPPAGFPRALSLTPASRRPTLLADETTRAVLACPIPRSQRPSESRDPEASIVVASFDSLPFTRLCLESVLAHTAPPEFELIVVDNNSRDGSREYLLELADRNRRVRLIANAQNFGFPAACNQGLAIARGKVLTLLNSDTMVAPGWLARLSTHLEDDSVGLVGPLTNRIGNEAEVATDYETWGGFLDEAARRAAAELGRTFELPTVTMFCLAMRRSVWERLGPLDADFGVGTLEDDDYSLRARRAGYRLLCAEDVLVHHFGEGSLGKLFEDGEYSRVIDRNRERFEHKWATPWEPYQRRQPAEYESLVEHVRQVLSARLPAGSTVLMVSKGDERLVELDGLRAWHFPCTPNGTWAGRHPADSAEAIAQLEELQEAGASYIAIPRPALWWLDFYEGLAMHLARRGGPLVEEDDCLVFALGPGGLPALAGQAGNAGERGR